LYLDTLDKTIYINKCKVTDVTKISYLKEDETYAELAAANYFVDVKSEPARIVIKETPSDIYTSLVNTVKIEFSAGYANAAAVPEPIKTAIKVILAHLFENREDVVVGRIANTLPYGSKYFLNHYRVNRL
jgi:uncharacterized phiE125 gp8 family phage protein